MHAARAASFGAVADAYERTRPGYPTELVAWLAGHPPRHVVDVGAGTGKLTRQLVATGHDVVAVEPDPLMARRLRAGLPQIRLLVAPAEALPLPDSSADALTAAQAYHWFEPQAFLAEAARVLRPGGVLGLIWNVDDESTAWLADLRELTGMSRFDDRSPAEQIESSGAFHPVERRVGGLVQRLQRADFIDLLASHSAVAVAPPEERTRMLTAAAGLYERYARPEGIQIPYTTYAYRATLRCPTAGPPG